MSQNKIMLKDGVLSKGGGDRRAILDYESGLVYSFDNPDNVIAYYQDNKGWVIRQKPYYSSGGWGNKAHGDGTNHYLISNGESLLRAIGATIYTINTMVFLNKEDLKQVNEQVRIHNELLKQHEEIRAKLKGKDVDFEELDRQKPVKLEYELDFRGGSKKGINPIKTATVYQKASEIFVNRKGKKTKVDSYEIGPDHITQGDKIVAFRDKSGQVFMNSEVLGITSFERNFMGNQSLIQKEVRKISKYNIPFNVLESANLSLGQTKILEQGPESEHEIAIHVRSGRYRSRETEVRHFTGALLLENKGRKFLMDIDRREIQHQIFNAFFVEVDKNVKSIAEAYESMKPQEVRDAETAGIEVLRQGEWFFIATDKTVTVPQDHYTTWKRNGDESKQVTRFELKHGKGRPNTVYKPTGFGELDQFVCGEVDHSGREHATLDLGSHEDTVGSNDDTTITFKLWKVVPNTTVGNFTITGDVD